MKDPALIKLIINGHSAVIGKLVFESKYWGLGLPPELITLIPEYISKNPKAKWAKDNAIDNVYVRLVEDDKFISYEKTYELLVDLNEREYIIWQLKYDTRR